MIKRFIFSCEADEKLSLFDWVYALTPYVGISFVLTSIFIKSYLM